MPIIVNKIGEHRNMDAVKNLIVYMIGSSHACHMGGRGICSLDPETVIENFAFTKIMYEKDDRKQIGHIIIGAKQKECLSMADLMMIGEITAEYYYQRGFQSCYVIHRGSDENQEYFHLHIAVNTINFRDGMRYYESYGNSSELRNILAAQFNQYRWILINDNSQSWEEG